MSVTRSPAGRVTITLVGSCALASLLSGCMILFPTEPEVSGNIALTAVEGDIAIVQCLEPKLELSGLGVSLVSTSEGTRSHRFIYVGNSGPTASQLPFGRGVSVAAPVLGLRTARSGDASVASIGGEVTIYVSVFGNGRRVEEAFRGVTHDDLREGQYIYRDGTVGTDPCADGGQPR